MLYSCTYMATVGVKGLLVTLVVLYELSQSQFDIMYMIITLA